MIRRLIPHLLIFLVLLALSFPASAQTYRPSRERPPVVTREFRAAWVASVYNIDWPSRKGLSAAAQQAEMRKLLDQAARLNLNAILFQVRPNADALYKSNMEPWSHWLTGTMGRSPGYDPLAYCISQAHARGIEVHAWFNPFRALTNVKVPACKSHVTRSHPSAVKQFKTYKWLDPSSSFARKRALAVIADVTRRYDVDGIHIDDYFYPYPDLNSKGGVKRQFPDGKTPSQRRAYVDGFVHDMYKTVKKIKPWVRVGISPFGIWKPGVPAGTTASINSYEHLAADSRKWLQKGWCDYMSPQLYWRVAGPQGYTKLLSWWRSQGSRPVWPGIATARIKSSEDPGRPASEIVNQVSLSRTVGRNYVGQVHWSMKSLMQNRGGISTALKKGAYHYPALVPPMPWISQKAPAQPSVQASRSGKGVLVRWSRVKGARKYALQARYGKRWYTVRILPASSTSVVLNGSPDAIALSAVDSYGTTSRASVLSK